MWKKSLHFFAEELWNFRLSDLRGASYWLYRWLRIATLSVQGFFTDKCTIRASSLTYYTLMSAVPIIAMMFAIAKGFGYQDTLRTELLYKFKEQKTAITEIIAFSDKLLEQTHGGVIAAIGILLLFWSATSLLSSMEDSLNHIWNIHKMRHWRRIVSDYFALLLIAPFFFILSSSAVVYFVKHTEQIIHDLPLGSVGISIVSFFLQLTPYAFSWMLFAFLYAFIPNTRVKISSAFVGGVVAGSIYILVQWGYVYFQIGMNRYGAIYGSFAALPLFLIWLQISWFIILFGAEVSYAHQTLESHEFEPAVKKMSYAERKRVILWMMQLAIKRFQNEKRPITLSWIIRMTIIPLSLASRVLDELVRSGLLLELKRHAYIPARPIESLRISDVLEAVENIGSSNFPFIQSKEIVRFEKVIAQFSEMIEQSSANLLLVELDDNLPI